MDQAILDKIVKIISPFVNDKEALNSLSASTEFLKDLKINSSRLVDITLDFEDQFGITITDDEADGIGTIGDAVALIKSKQPSSAAA